MLAAIDDWAQDPRRQGSPVRRDQPVDEDCNRQEVRQARHLQISFAHRGFEPLRYIRRKMRDVPGNDHEKPKQYISRGGAQYDAKPHQRP
jgi:hypothetical protein